MSTINTQDGVLKHASAPSLIEYGERSRNASVDISRSRGFISDENFAADQFKTYEWKNYKNEIKVIYDGMRSAYYTITNWDMSVIAFNPNPTTNAMNWLISDDGGETYNLVYSGTSGYPDNVSVSASGQTVCRAFATRSTNVVIGEVVGTSINFGNTTNVEDGNIVQVRSCKVSDNVLAIGSFNNSGSRFIWCYSISGNIIGSRVGSKFLGTQFSGAKIGPDDFYVLPNGDGIVGITNSDTLGLIPTISGSSGYSIIIDSDTIAGVSGTYFRMVSFPSLLGSHLVPLVSYTTNAGTIKFYHPADSSTGYDRFNWVLHGEILSANLPNGSNWGLPLGDGFMLVGGEENGNEFTQRISYTPLTNIK